MWSLVLCIITVIPITSSYRTPQCPQQCYCTYDYTDCKNNDLTDLPFNLDPRVQSLDLSYNEFEVVPESINIYSAIKYLNLSNNRLSTLDHNAFSGLTNVQFLDLTFNKFSDWMDIKSLVFTNTRSLKFLDFSHNPLGGLPGEKHLFHIASLEVLRLKNCSIKTLNSFVFSNLTNILELHLSHNPINAITTGFASRSLKFLDLSHCNLKHITSRAFYDLLGVETLWLHHNIYLKRFTCSSQSLLYLDISNCNLEAVPNGFLPKVYYANFHGNHFRVIDKDNFVNFTSLKYLDLSYNAISGIDELAFQSLGSVEWIDLSRNTLSTLHREVFYLNGNLRLLNLSRNYISEVVPLVSDTLEILDLSSCEIHSVTQNCLVDMPKLQTLNLSKNVISTLPDNLQSSKLERLDASLCRIKNINNRTFAMMGALRQLNLAGNRLTTTYPECYLQIVSLEISDNPWRCDCLKLREMYIWLMKTGKKADGLVCQSPEIYEGLSWLAACQRDWHPEIFRRDTVWWYTTGLIVTVFVILFIILVARRIYLRKEKRIRQADEARRAEERETLRRMRRMQLEAREEESRNAPDPRDLLSLPSYHEALLLPRLDASHPSLSGSLHSIASKHSQNGSNPDVSRRSRVRRKRRRRKSDSSEGQRASQVVVDSDTSDQEQPQPRPTLESDF